MSATLRLTALAAAAALLPCAAMAQASLTSTGYTQNFDSLGTSGTTLPTGWAVYSIAGAHSDWETSIPASVVGGGTATSISSALLDSAITTSTKGTAAYNIAHAATPTDRVLSTDPSGNAGTLLQLSLTNSTGSAVSALSLSYDIDKFTDGTNQPTQTSGLPDGEELPGYELFYSLDGTTWTNVSALNPVATADGVHPVVATGTPAASGSNPTLDYAVTSISGYTLNLATPLAAGSTLTLRWVDDNAVNISPDQMIGLNNVSIASVSAVPEPASLGLLMVGLVAVGLRARQQRRG